MHDVRPERYKHIKKVKLGTPVEERLCTTCGVVEDETRFLISCKAHQGKERVDMLNFASSLNNSFQHLSQLDKCVIILTSKNRQLMSLVAIFVYVNFMKRLKLLQ